MDAGKGRKRDETCVVLAGGQGTRLCGVSGGRNKHASPVSGRPALEYVLAPVFASPWVRKTAIVVQPRDREWLESLLASMGRRDASICIQPEPNGTLSAVQCALPDVDTGIFSVHYGDNIFGWNRLPDPEGFAANDAAAEIFTMEDLTHAHEYGVLEVDETPKGRVASRLEEKPLTLVGFRRPRILTGFSRFRTDSFLRAAERVPLSPRGEFELTDALHRLMQPPFYAAVRSAGVGWVDYGTPEKFLRAAGILSERERPARLSGANGPVALGAPAGGGPA